VFDEILFKIQYATVFINFAYNIIKQLEPIQKVNVIHLRVESDAIQHWSDMNKHTYNDMTYDKFQKEIEAKYIEMITKYMDRKDKIVILSNSYVNSVIDFLIQNDYNIMIPTKYFEHREKNAIVDLFVSRACNNVFLGCMNKPMNIGSSFSHYISKIIDKSVKKIGINIDYIRDNECVFY